jgi:YjjG family noncanonical pyrimidine nucleotidase
MRYDWILFDADHTLFDFDKSSEEALADTLLKHGVAEHKTHWLTYNTINKACWAAFEKGEIDRETMRTQRFSHFFEQINAQSIDIDDFGNQYLQSLPLRPYFIDGATELLSGLHGRVKLGIITNGLREVQRPRLESTGIDKYFDVIVVSGEIDLMKPNHAFFDHTHQLMGRPEKDRVLVVGDSLSADIAGGAGYGFKTCWFNQFDAPINGDVKPDYQINELYKLPEIAGVGRVMS